MKVAIVAPGLEITPELRGYLLARLRLALPHRDPPQRATVYLWDAARGSAPKVRTVSTPAGPVHVRLEGYAPRVHCLVSVALDRMRNLAAEGSGATVTSAANLAAARLANAAEQARERAREPAAA